MNRQLAQTRWGIKAAMPRMQEIARRVIDIEEDRVETPLRGTGIKASFRCGESKEIRVDEATPWILSQSRSERNQTALVPIDHCLQRIDYDQLAHGRMLQCSDRSIAEAKAADDHIVARLASPGAGVQRGKTQISQRDFDFMEQAGHQKRLAKFHFENLQIIQHSHATPAQRKIAQRSLPEIQLGEVATHAGGA